MAEEPALTSSMVDVSIQSAIGENGRHPVRRFEKPCTYEHILNILIIENGGQVSRETCSIKEPGFGTIPISYLSQQVRGERLEVSLGVAPGRPQTTENIRVVPRPESARQDVKPLFEKSIKGGAAELFDNSLQATIGTGADVAVEAGGMHPSWRPTIWFQFFDDEINPHLVIQDNGVGMSRDILKSYLEEAATHSRIPDIPRANGLPMCIDSYINPALNRYGVGCNVLTGFGRSYSITTREVGSDLSHGLNADFDDWVLENRAGNIGWGGVLSEIIHVSLDDDGPEPSAPPSRGMMRDPLKPGGAFSLPHGTQIVIGKLEKKVLAELRDAQAMKRLKGEIAQTYCSYLIGIPAFVRRFIPQTFQDGAPDTPARSRGLAIWVLDTLLDRDTLRHSAQRALGATPAPAPSASADQGLADDELPAFFKVIEQYQDILKQKGPECKPFPLFLRFVPEMLEEELKEALEPGTKDTGCATRLLSHKESFQIGRIGDDGRSTDPAAASKALEDVAFAAAHLMENRTLPTLAAAAVAAAAAAVAAGAHSQGGPGQANRRKQAKPKIRKSNASTSLPGTPSGDPPVAHPRVYEGPLRMRDPVDEPPRCVDMMLLLFAFPTEMGLPTKPNGGKGVQIGNWAESEPFIFPFWSGRLMPECELMKGLPRLVDRARELGARVGSELKSFKLTDKRLSGLVYISPECYAMYHKTDLQDRAFDAFVNLGVAPDQAFVHPDESDLGPDEGGTMLTFDFLKARFVKDSNGALATRLLLCHFAQFWRNLDREGRIVDMHYSDSDHHNTLVAQGSQYDISNPSKFTDYIEAGELVRVVDPEKGLSAEADKAGTAVGAAGGSRSAAQQQHCCDFYKIVRFYEEGGDSINEHKVELVQWRPSWSTRPPKSHLRPIVEMFPLEGKTRAARMREATRLITLWEEDRLPHHLAFVKRASATKGRKNESGNKNSELTTDPLMAEGLPEREGNSFQAHNVPNKITVHLATLKDKPLSFTALSKNLGTKESEACKTCTATLYHMKDKAPSGSVVWRSQIASESNWPKFNIEGFGSFAVKGSFKLKMELDGSSDLWPTSNCQLVYSFSVKAEPAVKVKAVFESADAGMALNIRLGETADKLCISLLDARGNQVPFPAKMNESSLRELCSFKLLGEVAATGKRARGAGPSSSSGKAELQSGSPDKAKMSFSLSKYTLTVTGLAVPGFALGDGRPDAREWGSRVVHLAVGFSFPEAEVPLEEAEVALNVFAGKPARLGCLVPGATEAIAKGELLSRDQASSICLYDPWNNLYCHQDCRDPEADPPQPLKAELKMQNVAYINGAIVAERICPFLPQGLVAMGPCGSFATIQACMVGEEFKDIPVFQVIRRQIFNVILGFGHPLLTEREEMLDGRRRRYRRTADQNNGTAEDLDGDGGGLSGCPSAQDFPGIVGTYRLDLQDRTRKFGNLAQPKLLSHETWSQNYDLLDSMEIHPNGSFLLPDGRRYSPSQKAQLLTELNARIASNKPVHDVVVVVEPWLRKLQGMKLQVCDGDDCLDPDFAADIKMELVNGTRRFTLPLLHYNLRRQQTPQQTQQPNPDPVDPADGSGGHRGKQKRRKKKATAATEAAADAPTDLPLAAEAAGDPDADVASEQVFDVDLPEALFESGPCAMVVFKDSHSDEVYGRFFIRQGWKLHQEGLQSASVDFENPADLKIGMPGICVRRNQAFRLYFYVGDRAGQALQVSPEQQKFIQHHAVVSMSSSRTSPAATGDPATDGRGPGHQSGSGSRSEGAGPAPHDDQGGQELICDIVPESWSWSALPCVRGGPLFPFFTFEVVVRSGQGSGVLSLRVAPPESAGGGQQAWHTSVGGIPAAAAGGWSNGGNGAGVLPGSFSPVEVPVSIARLPMRADGYQVRAASATSAVVIRARSFREATSAHAPSRQQNVAGGVAPTEPTMAEETAARGNDGREEDPPHKLPRTEPGVEVAGGQEAAVRSSDHPLQQQPQQPVEFEVLCREEKPAGLEIQLVDEQGQPLAEDTGAFTATCSTLPDGGWAAGRVLYVGPGGKLRLSVEPPRVQRDHAAVAAENEATATPDLDLDPATMRVLQEHRLVLEPSSSNLNHAMPLVLIFKVQAGSYPVSMQFSNVWGLDSPDDVIDVHLPDRDPPPGGGIAATATTRAPKVCVRAADGSDYSPSIDTSQREARPIHLQWIPVLLEMAAGQDTNDYTPPELPNLPVSTKTEVDADPTLGANLGPAGADGETVIQFPHRAGQWRLEASLAGLPDPVALATFLVKGSRPTQIALSRFDDEGRPLAALPPTVVVQRPPELGRDEAAGGIGGGQNDTDMVKLRGWLADRYGNKARADLRLSVQLCVRVTPSLLPEGTAPPLVEPLILNTHSRRAGDVFKFIPSKTLSEIVANYEDWIGAERLQELQVASNGEQRRRQLTYDIYLVCGKTLETPPAEAEEAAQATGPPRPPRAVAPLEGDERIGELLLTTVMMVSSSSEKVLNDRLHDVNHRIKTLDQQKLALSVEYERAAVAVAEARERLANHDTYVVERFGSNPTWQTFVNGYDIEINKRLRLVENGVFEHYTNGGHLLKPWTASRPQVPSSGGPSQGGGGGREAFLRTMSQEQSATVRAMSNLCWDQHIERLSLPPGEQIIGPMICLGGVERRAVAAALAALSGSSDSFFTVAVLGQAAKRLVKDAFDRENVKNFSIMDLTDENGACQFKKMTVNNDPQKTLRIDHPFGAVLGKMAAELKVPLNPDTGVFSGFVGFAVNLVVLPQPLLDWRQKLPVESGVNRHIKYVDLTLRESVLHASFRDAMVFETERDITAFLKECRDANIRFRNRLIALDGFRYNMKPGLEQRSPLPNNGFGWSGVPSEMQLLTPLDAKIKAVKIGIEQKEQKKEEARRLPEVRERLDADVRQVEETMQRSQEQLSVFEEAMPRSMEELLTERDGILSELEGLRKVNGDGETGFEGERQQGAAAADAAGSRRRRYGSGAGGGNNGAAEGTSKDSDRAFPGGSKTRNGSAEGGEKKRQRR